MSVQEILNHGVYMDARGRLLGIPEGIIRAADGRLYRLSIWSVRDKILERKSVSLSRFLNFRHPHMETLVGMEVESERVQILTELVHGVSLGQLHWGLLAGYGLTVSQDVALFITAKLAWTLDALHALRDEALGTLLVHGEVSPHTVAVSRGGES